MRSLSLVSIMFLACNAASAPGGDSHGLKPAAGKDRLLLAGSAFLIAPIAGAHVTATRIGRSHELVGETTTGPDGAWTFDLYAVDGDILIEVLGDRGGSCLEPATGVAPISLSQDDRMATIVPRASLGQELAAITINPVTTLVAARALAEARAGISISDAWKKNVDLFSAHFDSPEPWASQPIDLVLHPAPGLSSGAIYSFITLAISQHALELGRRAGVTDVSVVNTWTVLRHLTRDLDDRVFDGKAQSAELPPLAANVRIDAETTRASLAKALESFLGSENNKSGFGARDLSKLINAIRQDKSELYPPGEPEVNRDPTVESGSPPAITITAPSAAQTVGQGSHLVAEIVDLDGVSDASVFFDGNLVGFSFDKTTPTKWTLDTPIIVQDGDHVFELTARDAKGNTSKKAVQFTFDGAPPSISFLACHAPNDLARTVTTNPGSAVFAPTTTDEPCLESTLGSGDQQFHTFADLLASAGADTPRIDLAVTDTTEIASVTCQLSINGTPIGSPTPCAEGTSPVSHVLSVSASVFGEKLLTLDVTDTASLRVVATDTLGNSADRTFAFRLNVLPTPLHVVAVPLTPQSAITSYSFAADNVDKLFDYANFPDHLVHLNAYNVTNLSARPAKLSLNVGFANEGAGWTRRTYKAPFQLYLGYSVSDGVGICGNGQALKFLRYNSYTGHQCVTPSALATIDMMSTGSIPTNPFDIRRFVFAANGSAVTPDDNAEVVLEPGQTYKVLLATRYPWFTVNPTSGACVATYGPEWINHGVVGAPSAIGGFYRKNLFFNYIMTGTTYSFYGYLTCSSNMVYNCPSTGFCGFDAFVNNGAVYPVSYALIERDLRFSTAATWTPRIRLSTSTASIAAKADRSASALAKNGPPLLGKNGPGRDQELS